MLCVHALCRFVVLVCGTLVYGKGDEHEHRKEYEALLADGEAPSSTIAPLPAAPMFAPVSLGATQTAPLAMATPSSYKVLLPTQFNPAPKSLVCVSLHVIHAMLALVAAHEVVLAAARAGGLTDLYTLVQSTMNIASYHRGSLASGSYMGGQSTGQDNADIVNPQ